VCGVYVVYVFSTFAIYSGLAVRRSTLQSNLVSNPESNIKRDEQFPCYNTTKK
jgi:hypothetical protein